MKPETLEIITKNAAETKKFGEILAKKIIKSRFKNKKAIVIGLEGELGSGKTTFVQGMAKGLGIKQRITSPTFVIMRKYKIPDTKYQIQNTRFYHIDCYRLSRSKDLSDLDFKEIIKSPQNIVVIEWAEKVKRILSKDAGWIKFEHLEKNKRKMIIF